MKIAFVINLIRDERGTSAIEMGLICGFIVIAMLAALQGFAGESTGLWSAFSNKFVAAAPQGT